KPHDLTHARLDRGDLLVGPRKPQPPRLRAPGPGRRHRTHRHLTSDEMPEPRADPRPVALGDREGGIRMRPFPERHEHRLALPQPRGELSRSSLGHPGTSVTYRRPHEYDRDDIDKGGDDGHP